MTISIFENKEPLLSQNFFYQFELKNIYLKYRNQYIKL
jgi:hypothetical protein